MYERIHVFAFNIAKPSKAAVALPAQREAKPEPQPNAGLPLTAQCRSLSRHPPPPLGTDTHPNRHSPPLPHPMLTAATATAPLCRHSTQLKRGASSATAPSGRPGGDRGATGGDRGRPGGEEQPAERRSIDGPPAGPGRHGATISAIGHGQRQRVRRLRVKRGHCLEGIEGSQIGSLVECPRVYLPIGVAQGPPNDCSGVAKGSLEKFGNLVPMDC